MKHIFVISNVEEETDCYLIETAMNRDIRLG